MGYTWWEDINTVADACADLALDCVLAYTLFQCN